MTEQIKQDLTKVADLNKAIDNWGTRGSKWTKDGQVLAMAALRLHAASGDIGPVNRLFLAMPKGTKSAAMAEWIITHCGMVANTGEDKKTKPFLHDKERASDEAAGAKNPWYSFQPEKTPDQVFDVLAAVQAIIKKASKAETVEHGDLLAQLAAMAGVDTEAGDSDPLTLGEDLGEATV